MLNNILYLYYIFNMFSLYITQKAVDLFNSFFTKKNNKNLIIDPFSCIVRLAILSFKPKGTKISIYDNKITYNDPTVFQGPIRWSQGDNREDLHNLYSPIVKALEWYDYNNPTIKNIFELSKVGLNKLKDSYNKSSSISHSITYYISLIEEKLIQTDNESTLDNDDNVIFKELKKLWNQNEITIVNTMLTEMKSTQVDELHSLINALESILSIKEKRVKSIIIENTTQLK